MNKAKRPKVEIAMSRMALVLFAVLAFGLSTAARQSNQLTQWAHFPPVAGDTNVLRIDSDSYYGYLRVRYVTASEATVECSADGAVWVNDSRGCLLPPHYWRRCGYTWSLFELRGAQLYAYSELLRWRLEDLAASTALYPPQIPELCETNAGKRPIT